MTRKFLTGCTLLLAALLLGLWLAPRLLCLDEVRDRMLNEVSIRLQAEVTVEQISWSWLPTPHLSLSSGSLKRPDLLEAALPHVDLYPDWMTLFRGRLRVHRLVLLQPELSWHQQTTACSTYQAAYGPPLLIAGLPLDLVEVENGRLTWYREGSSDLSAKPIEFAQVNLHADLSENALPLKLTCRPPFGESLAAEGTFDPRRGAYDFRVNLKRFRPHELPIPLNIHHPLYPTDSEVNLEASVVGQGGHRFRAKIMGDSPRLLLRPADREVLLSCNTAEFEVERVGPRLIVRIDQLAMTNPRFALEGLAEVTLRSDADHKISSPLLFLDLKARDVDLNAVRANLLTLWGEHRVTQEVCAIVKGGEAKAASFAFQGPVTDLSDLANMTITADVDSAAIHVPRVDLDLEEAHGPIRIANGVLTGEGLAALLGGSHGWDGNLLLGLKGQDPPFHLDLQLQANLAELPPLLDRLVPHPGFHRELALFDQVRGQANGRLILGERLSHVKVQVKVASLDVNARYRRIPWPIKATEGQLNISPPAVTWKQVKGAIGPHRIHEASGTITIGPNPSLTISPLSADLDIAPLYAELVQYRLVRNVLQKIIASPRGTLEVRGLELVGPWDSPEAWNYRFLARTGELDFHSPMLPGPAVLHRAVADVSNYQVDLLECKTSVAGYPLTLSGHLLPPGKKLHGFEYSAPNSQPQEGIQDPRRGWQGSLEITGQVDGELADWVKHKAWIPEPYFPRTPCHLKGLRVTWGEKGVTVRGQILTAADLLRSHWERRADLGPVTPDTKHPGQDASPRVTLDLDSRPPHLTIRTFRIQTREDESVLSLDLDSKAGRLRLAWDGRLDGKTLDLVLACNTFLRGELRGSWAVHYDRAEPLQTRITGILEAHDFPWSWGLTQPVTIDRLLVTGRGTSADVEAATLIPGQEAFEIQGGVGVGPRAVHVDLDLQSAMLSWETLIAFLPMPWDEKAPVASPEEVTPPWPLEGEVRFEIGQFQYTHPVSPPKKGRPRIYTWRPMMGRLILGLPRSVELEVTRARLCNLGTTGTFRHALDGNEIHLRITAEESFKTNIEDVLPCLGYPQDLIKGETVIEVNLAGTPGDWKSGTVKIRSEDGRIYRLTVLAKVFRVLNVLDLFSGGLPDLMSEGFGYYSLDIEGHIKNNLLSVQSAVVKGEGLNVFGQGSIDLKDWDLKLTVLVAPLKTLDAVVQRMPILGAVIGGTKGTVVTVPVGITGPMADPKVSLMPPDAVGEGLLGVVKRTLGLPLQILRPIVPQGTRHSGADVQDVEHKE